MAERTVSDGDVVVITYTLEDADSGEILDRAPASRPFAYLQGHDSVIPGLEKALAGKAAGETFDVVVEPAEGYGERKGPGPQPVPRREFRKDADIHPGMRFMAEDSEGNEVPLWVTKVAGSRVYVDTEHPMVGRRLHFTGAIVAIREPTEDELAHGHAHGPDGHGHDH